MVEGHGGLYRLLPLHPEEWVCSEPYVREKTRPGGMPGKAPPHLLPPKKAREAHTVIDEEAAKERNRLKQLRLASPKPASSIQEKLTS